MISKKNKIFLFLLIVGVLSIVSYFILTAETYREEIWPGTGNTLLKTIQEKKVDEKQQINDTVLKIIKLKQIEFY